MEAAHPDRRVFATAPALIFAIIVAMALATAILCGGRLTYALDDPYISLSLAWHIAHGHYGLNAVEFASPSSSIAYPFLLAAFAWTPFQEWIPLIINSAAATATTAIIAALCARYCIGTRPAELMRTAFLITALCVSINIAGLVFTGLEHSLHTFTSAATIYGLLRTLEDDEVPPWLVVVLALNPLLRFEGAALTVLVILALAITRHIRSAVAAFLTSAAGIGVYMWSMSSLGLPLLPSSVLIKTMDKRSEDPGLVSQVLHLLQHGAESIFNYAAHGLPIWIPAALVVLHPIVRARGGLRSGEKLPLTWARELILAAVVLGTIIAHALFGAFGGWFRYEIYVVVVTNMAAIALWHRQVARWISGASWRTVTASAVIFLALCAFYVRCTILTPMAGRNIHEQQFQMHRFAVDFYRRPVAVNDLGWVSYRNPQYVLDLWGLGSEAARRARLITHQPGWMDDLSRQHNVGVAMIFPSWFPGQVPRGWHLLAHLRSAHPHISAASDDVSIYATSDSAVPEALQALHRYASSTSASVAQIVFEPTSG